MSAFELTWFNLKKAWYDNEDFRGDPEDEEAHRRGEDEEHQNWLDSQVHPSQWDENRIDDVPKDTEYPGREDAPTLDPNHILRLTRSQLDKLIQDAKSEIKRRGTKKANKNVAVVDSPVKGMANANEWIKHNPWMGE